MDAQTHITLPEELFEVSGSSTFTGILDLPELKAGPDMLRFDAPLPWQVLVVNAGEGSLLVSGDIRGTARCGCARCLEEFDLDLNGEVEGFIFLADPGDNVPEDMDEDEYLVMGEDRSVDISDFLKAALVLDAPLIPLHDKDCKGLCPQCGANLNEAPCGCTREADPDFETARNPFAALRDYKFEN